MRSSSAPGTVVAGEGLIEIDLGLGWSAGRGDARGSMGEPEMSEDAALAINLQGQKELLGPWVGEAEGAKFWLSVLTELKNRGVQDALIAAVDERDR